MSPTQASRLGLVEIWRRQMQVPAGAQSIVKKQLYVKNQSTQRFVEVIEAPAPADPASKITVAIDATASGATPDDAKVLARIPFDGDGVAAIDQAEAERRGRQQMRLLARRGIAAKMTLREVPSIHLYTIGDDGSVQCHDAETGELKWLRRVGERNRGYGELGVSDKRVSVLNGSELIELDAANGEEINTIAMPSVPLFGVMHAGDFALIPTIRGGVECFPLTDTTIDPFMELVAGTALAMPAHEAGSNLAAWGTDRGFVYVIELSGTPQVLFRLDTDGIVSGRIATATEERFFFGSEAGQVYAIQATTRTGDVLWNKPFGEPFYNEPLVFDEVLLIRSTYGSLYALDAATGISVWDDVASGVDELIGAFDGKIFVRTLAGHFAVLDFETGKVIDSTASIQPSRLLTNFISNRLYFVDSAGTVQCLKPIDSELPVLSHKRTRSAGEATSEGDESKDVKSTPKPGPVNDPFAPGGADPFGAGAADPFGAGAGAADPFGAGGGAADPFGADPFGN